MTDKVLEHASPDWESFEGYEDLLDDPRTSYHPVPKKLISTFIKRGMVSIPVTSEQAAILKFLQWAWEDTSKLLLRFMLGSVRRRDREMLLEFPHLGRIERYILTLFFNKTKRSPRDVQHFVKHRFGFEYPIEDIEKIRKLSYRKNSIKKDRVLLANNY
jgi:hypothetical protein